MNATDKSCCGAQFFWKIPGVSRETMSIPTEASTSTLWIERECAAVVGVFQFVGFSVIPLAHALFQFGSRKQVIRQSTTFSSQRSREFNPRLLWIAWIAWQKIS